MKAPSAATPPNTKIKPFSKLEWHIAGKYLRSNRRDGFISVIASVSFLGIMLGVATLIIVMAVMNGFRTDLLTRILGVSGHAVVRPHAGAFEDREKLIEALLRIKGVKRASPLIDGQAMVSNYAGARGVLIRGMTEASLRNLPALDGRIEAGQIEGMTAKNGIAIGALLAEQYGLAVGDELALITPRGTLTPFGTAPRIKSHQISAIFRIGLSEYDSSIVFVPLVATAELLGLNDASGAIEVILDSADDVDEIVDDMRAAIGDAHYVVTWKQSNATLSGALEVERNVMFLILALILLEAALNIVSGLFMLVKDKGRDIAVFRSMGASRGMILRIFFITGASIGVVGTCAGLGVGTLFCAYIEQIRQFLVWATGADLFPAQIYFLDKMPAEIRGSDVSNVVILSLFLSFVSTLYPAWRAASLQPVEALRYE